MSMLRLCFAVSIGVLNWVVTSNPAPKPKKHEEVTSSKQETSFISIALNFYGVPLGILLLAAVLESCVVLAVQYPTELSPVVTSLLFPEGGFDSAAHVSITPFALITGITAVFGCLLRYFSIKRLGHLFTFRLAVRTDHALVTSGPYAYVRHPGYTGNIIAAIGSGMFFLGPGSYAYECGLLKTIPGVICTVTWVGWKLFTTVNIIRRTAFEDEFLRAKFGKQWDAWARNVGYRLLPGVY
ncbi:ICMT-domain-containing protein [Fomitiporia mediterranea MF3/22]|uniref:ICMT-domain-containing protein n=1 Tax=Fomitiporia mediterranea (strain MF3/22) TaxID=694068 RepID=UPI00044072A9|nr:ICMT-domain-containing protein [Fomitiporia mediterranea MF3/22]EJD00173.1 ICMT-domain-containing protein [Fomitiporia mediterranea MF3/22]